MSDPDPAGLVRRIAAPGWRQRGQTWPATGDGHYQFVNAEDPLGNLIEIDSRDRQRMFANGG